MFIRNLLYCPLMKTKQTNLFEYFGKDKKRYGRTQYGGAPTTGHRKLERPLDTRKWIHLVLKSDKAVGKWSFLLPKNKAVVDSVIKAKARKFGIVLADIANVGNHIHLKIK